MPLSLLRDAFDRARGKPVQPILPARPERLQPHYDVAIIGAGGHGLATAYYLAARHGITKVCVLDKSWLAGGNTARNTAIVRSNYLTPEGVAFYERSRQLWAGLSHELDFNLLYSPRGHLTLAHTDSALNTMRWRAEVNKHSGVDSRVVYPDELARLCPELYLGDEVRLPVQGALYHPPGAIARHDAIAWGYAQRASERGVEIHTGTEVTGITQAHGRVTGLETTRGTISCGAVVQATAGNSSRTAALAGLKLPITTIPLQACVTEPVKPFLDPIVVSASLHTYVSQSARGELVMGGATDPYALYANRATLDFKEGLMAHLLELFPFAGELQILRQWAGMADMTPDFAPVMGATELGNYYIDAGWGTWGFKATPVCGETMAETVAAGRPAELIRPFDVQRFANFAPTGEKGAASVGH